MTRRSHLRGAGLSLALLVLFAVLAGCGSEPSDRAPSACLTGSAQYVAALKAAPGDVRLQGETPISDCLTTDQGGGELAQIGQEMVAAATVLNGEARKDPTGPAAVQLGYLVGAVERGASGIHADLVRRINSAARFSPGGLLPAEFERTFGQGYAAGKESG
jgi:hypothetical protein